MRIALGIEYDGTDYFGWQKQAAVPSIQAAVEAALSKVADHEIQVYCAGRTDAGVHAIGQVLHFDTSANRPLTAWTMGVNSYLPPDIRIQWAQECAADFHARFSAISRQYAYFIHNSPTPSALLRHRALRVYKTLDVELMQTAANYLIGEHDFSAFRSSGCQSRSPNRCVTLLTIQRQGDMVVLKIKANAFLLHMVRNITGLLIEVGLGIRPPEWAQQVLLSCDRQTGGVTKTIAPQGLYLTQVDY